MISKNEIKFVKSLSQKKFRDKESLFIVEGEKLVMEADSSGYEIVSLYRKDEIGDDNMSRISSLSSPPPVLAVVKMRVYSGSILPKPGTLSLVLESLRDPGNMGTIIRLADWFGIDNIYASSDSVEMYNNKVIQASMGSVFRKSVFYTDIKELVKEVKGKELIYTTVLDGESIYEADISQPGLIIIGNESSGVSEELVNLADKKLFIPPYPGNLHRPESLNVATATAIVCSEFRRFFALKSQIK
jgi:TrmH family RNA methyltransferase